MYLTDSRLFIAIHIEQEWSSSSQVIELDRRRRSIRYTIRWVVESRLARLRVAAASSSRILDVVLLYN